MTSLFIKRPDRSFATTFFIIETLSALITEIPPVNLLLPIILPDNLMGFSFVPSKLIGEKDNILALFEKINSVPEDINTENPS